ncbi:MAG: hypothetical protein OEW40_15710 [Cyclobacteriaceae bacterium]|nr:hypothetical protein [Cyclobacteriaceae bacterium]
MLYSITSFSQPATAQHNSAEKRFYVGLNAGTGLLLLSKNDLNTSRDARFSLGFFGGYKPNRWLRTGIILNGWLIEAFGAFGSNPEKGVSISNVYGQLQIFPFAEFPIFANISGGYSSYTNHHPDEFNAHGSGGLFGLGYEKDLSKRLAASFVVNYGFGRFKDVENVAAVVKNQHYDVIEFLVAIVYH